MKFSVPATLAAFALAGGLWAASTPAFALGACGANHHRNAAGYCVAGGQNQACCLRHTGHVADYGRNGTRWC